MCEPIFVCCKWYFDAAIPTSITARQKKSSKKNDKYKNSEVLVETRLEKGGCLREEREGAGTHACGLSQVRSALQLQIARQPPPLKKKYG